jgi:hypothetical protein
MVDEVSPEQIKKAIVDADVLLENIRLEKVEQEIEKRGWKNYEVFHSSILGKPGGKYLLQLESGEVIEVSCGSNERGKPTAIVNPTEEEPWVEEDPDAKKRTSSSRVRIRGGKVGEIEIGEVNVSSSGVEMTDTKISDMSGRNLDFNGANGGKIEVVATIEGLRFFVDDKEVTSG